MDPVMSRMCCPAVIVTLCLAGCAGEQPKPDQNAPGKPKTVPQKLTVTGFDPEGEPVIETTEAGTIRVVFNFMPPSYAKDPDKLGPFAEFDKQMERAVGVPVQWEDREVFVIKSPKEDTAARIKAFLEGYRKKK